MSTNKVGPAKMDDCSSIQMAEEKVKNDNGEVFTISKSNTDVVIAVPRNIGTVVGKLPAILEHPGKNHILFPSLPLSLSNKDLHEKHYGKGKAKSTGSVDTIGSTSSLLSLASIKQEGAAFEAGYQLLSQICIPMSLAAFGMVWAGYLLNYFSTWIVFLENPLMLVVVTPLLGLKGNLEMTFASRMSTYAHLGHLDKLKMKLEICLANLCVDQVQAIIAGLIASLLATLMAVFITGTEMNPRQTLILASTCCATASLVSLILGSTMCTLIVIARTFNYDPDNFATAIAGMLGDVTTLTALTYVGTFIYGTFKNYPWIPCVTLGINSATVLLCGFMAASSKHCQTRRVLRTGWISVIIAVIISSGGGLILQQFESRHSNMVFYQPIINGIGGNLVAVMASRLSTHLYRFGKKGVLPHNGSIWVSPIEVFLGNSEHATVTRLLLIQVISYQVLCPTVLHFINSATEYTVSFVGLFVLASLVQAIILMYLSRIVTNLCWVLKFDPDCNTIPYLTALGDLLGSSLLLGVFEILLSVRKE